MSLGFLFKRRYKSYRVHSFPSNGKTDADDTPKLLHQRTNSIDYEVDLDTLDTTVACSPRPLAGSPLIRRAESMKGRRGSISRYSKDSIRFSQVLRQTRNSVVLNGSLGAGDLSVTVVVKAINQSDPENNEAMERLVFERDLLLSISHTNIINVMGYAGAYDGSACVIQGPLLILEKLNGSVLKDALKKPLSLSKYPFSLLRALEIARDIASALQYLHHEYSSDIVVLHRDLQPDNITLTSDGRAVISDFEECISVRYTDAQRGAFNLLPGKGAVAYRAPEMMRNEPYSERVDVYSFGILLWVLLSGGVPYSGLNDYELVQGVSQTGVRPDIASAMSRVSDRRVAYGLKSLITSCWNDDHLERMDISDIYSDIREFWHREMRSVSAKKLTTKNAHRWILGHSNANALLL